MPEVSVIIPNYNHAAFLQQRINSVLDQAFRDFEVIILDDCSPDNSRDIIEQYRQHSKVKHIVYNEKNSGATFKQWQKGIELAAGKYIWIAESDDFCEVDFLTEALLPFKTNEQVGLVYTQSYSCNTAGDITGSWLKHTSNIKSFNWNENFCSAGPDFIKNCMLKQNSIPNASAVVFKKAALASALLNNNYTINGDWYLYLNLLISNSIFYIARPLNYFRNHGKKGSSANIKNYNNIKEYGFIISFIFKKINLTGEEKEQLRDGFFLTWYNQGGRKIVHILKNQFFAIFSLAFKNDPKIAFRFLKAILFDIKAFIKMYNKG